MTVRVNGNRVAIDPIFDSDFVEVDEVSYEAWSPEEVEQLKKDKLFGKLIIPDEAKNKCNQGLVKYTGPDVVDVRVGDYVLFSGYSGTTVRLEGEGILIIMPEEFIVCKVDPPETDIPGLFFRDIDGEYWTVTYEMVTQFMRKRFEELQPAKNVRVNEKTEYVRGL